MAAKNCICKEVFCNNFGRAGTEDLGLWSVAWPICHSKTLFLALVSGSQLIVGTFSANEGFGSLETGFATPIRDVENPHPRETLDKLLRRIPTLIHLGCARIPSKF